MHVMKVIVRHDTQGTSKGSRDGRRIVIDGTCIFSSHSSFEGLRDQYLLGLDLSTFLILWSRSCAASRLSYFVYGFTILSNPNGAKP